MKINEGIKLATGPAYGECGSLLPLSCPLPRAKAAACRRSPKSPSSCTTRSPKSGSRAPAFSNQGRIKAKTPAIVPHQGKSRQPMINHFTVMTPTRWIGRTGRRTVKACTQEKSSPGGEETGEGERPTKLSGRVAMPVCPRPSRSPKSETRTRFPPNQGKNPSNRASSRQIKANAQISKTPR